MADVMMVEPPGYQPIATYEEFLREQPTLTTVPRAAATAGTGRMSYQQLLAAFRREKNWVPKGRARSNKTAEQIRAERSARMKDLAAKRAVEAARRRELNIEPQRRPRKLPKNPLSMAGLRDHARQQGMRLPKASVEALFRVSPDRQILDMAIALAKDRKRKTVTQTDIFAAAQALKTGMPASSKRRRY
jgi:histone H3/H4